jgi:AraC family transcriptional regulator, arabinose operon regulatory protein
MGISPQAVVCSSDCPHGCEHAILLYCAKGRGWCEIGAQRHTIAAGDLLVIPPFTGHNYGPDPAEPWTVPWLHMTGDNIGLLLNELGVSVENPIINVGDDPRVLAHFEDAIAVGLGEQAFTTTKLFHSAQTVGRLLGLINSKRRHQAQRPPDGKERVAECIEFMKQHLSEVISLDRLAAIANLSPSRFSAIFRKETGYAPVEYLVRLRMERARQLLDTTDLAVKEICSEAGYNDPFYFSRAFRSVVGLSPSEYRDREKAGLPESEETSAP